MSSFLTLNTTKPYDVISEFGNLKVVSYNMHGFNQGISMLKSLCFAHKVQILYLQENWLTTDQLSNFHRFKNDYDTHGISEMGDVLNRSILRGRSFGGVSVFIRKSLSSLATNVNVIACSKRYVIITVDNLLLVNV